MQGLLQHINFRILQIGGAVAMLDHHSYVPANIAFQEKKKRQHCQVTVQLLNHESLSCKHLYLGMAGMDE
jgi:hypothetical protein